MSLATLSQIIRALHADNLPDEDAGLVARAYAASFAGSKPWMLTQKEAEHVTEIFRRIYVEH